MRCQSCNGNLTVSDQKEIVGARPDSKPWADGKQRQGTQQPGTIHVIIQIHCYQFVFHSKAIRGTTCKITLSLLIPLPLEKKLNNRMDCVEGHHVNRSTEDKSANADKKSPPTDKKCDASLVSPVMPVKRSLHVSQPLPVRRRSKRNIHVSLCCFL